MIKNSIRSVYVSVVLSAIIILSFMILAGCLKKAPPVSDYPIKPVLFTKVKVTDNFWAKRLLINHRVTIPIAFKMAEETGRIDNFRIAGSEKEGKFCSLYPFDDSDVYKNIEAACYSMQLFPDPRLDAYLDSLISTISAAQESDGYLYTNRTIDPAHTHEMAGNQRWEKEEESSHELYNAGHLYEAAVAHFQATGKRTLLDVAIKNADLIDKTFGWGRIEKAPGHQEIEIGLVKLFRVTGDRKYLDLAKFFLDVRGPGGDEYNQMHKKVLDQKTAVGHAVRAQYMYSAMADIAALTGQQEYLHAIDTLWSDVVKGKTYITGGIGSVRDNEGFGEPYVLPNMEAYCETCAAIANAFWNYRMFLLHGDSKYFDVFEKVLYNGLLSGVSLSGDRFFYPNPLASNGQYARKPWFGCACCPVNITRFLPSLPGYIYAVDDDNLYVNLFIGNQADVTIKDQDIKLMMDTEYPWEGHVQLKIDPEKPFFFNLKIRIPGWARNEAFPSDLYYFEDTAGTHPEISLNGEKIQFSLVNGYASISRKWNKNDEVIIDLPMEPRKVRANILVKADEGRVAIQRGPVIYCMEALDQEISDINRNTVEINRNKVEINRNKVDINGYTIDISRCNDIVYEFRGDLLGGIGTLKFSGILTDLSNLGKTRQEPCRIVEIPYYAWANRDQGEMEVWLRESRTNSNK